MLKAKVAIVTGSTNSVGRLGSKRDRSATWPKRNASVGRRRRRRCWLKSSRPWSSSPPVNAGAPGAIKTPMHSPETHEILAKQHPIGRMGEVRDVVDAVLYLEGAAFVTGEIPHVDGGQSVG